MLIVVRCETAFECRRRRAYREASWLQTCFQDYAFKLLMPIAIQSLRFLYIQVS